MTAARHATTLTITLWTALALTTLWPITGLLAGALILTTTAAISDHHLTREGN